MKRFILISLLLIACIIGVSNWPSSNVVQSQYPSQKITVPLNGEWRPDVDPAVVGIGDFTDMQNMRYYGGPSPKEYRLEGVMGYSDINTTQITDQPNFQNGIHFKKDNPQESHVLVYSKTSGDTLFGVYKNDTAIPGQGDFSGATVIFQDSSGADTGRFSLAPMQHVVYSNSKDLNQIWGGDEMPVAAFITSTSNVTEFVQNPKDYTVQVNNLLDDAENVALIGGGNDEFAKLLLKFEGQDGSTAILDSASGSTASPHTIVPGGGNSGTISIDQKKFGISGVSFTARCVSCSGPAGTSIYVAHSVDWIMTNGDGSGNTLFTIDLWFYPEYFKADPTGRKAGGIYSQKGPSSGNDLIQLIYYTDQGTRTLDEVEFTIWEGGIAWILTEAGPDLGLPLNQWYHIAVIRGWNGDLAKTAVTLNGKSYSVSSVDRPWPGYENPLIIGASGGGGGVTSYANGHIDEFRVSKGIARWTSNFNPPTKAYQTPANTFLIGATRAFSGASITAVETNPLSGQTIVWTTWNGDSWTALNSGTTEYTQGLTRSGISPWGNQVGIQKRKYLEGRLLFWAQGQLSAGEASISHVTLDEPWQDMTDHWDHVPRQPIRFMALNYSNGVEEWDDWTLEVNANEPFYEFGAQLGGQTTFVVMFQDRIQGLLINMISGSTVDSGSTPFYWGGEDYAASGVTYDSTESLRQSGHYTWTPPEFEEEFPRERFGTKGYTYEFVFTEPFDSASDTDGTVINTVYGIPAPLSLKPFKFTFMYKGRLFKCNYAEGNQPNRCDYTPKDMPDIWNGEESSANRRYGGPLFFGDGGELLAGTELYNRYGSKTYSWGLLISRSKTFSLEGDGPDNWKIYVVNENIGIVAPLTLATAVMTYNVEGGELDRLVAMWLDFSGPIMFDGSSPRRIKGIDSFFDPNHANYLGASDISNARAWFSRTYQEYNLRIGDSFWVAYDTKRKRWIPKSTGSQPIPQFGMEVVDTNGTAHTFSGCTDGMIRRMDYGTTWDGTGIEQVLQTGEFRLSNDAWQDTHLKKILLENVVLSEVATLDILHYRDTSTLGKTIEGVLLNSGAFRTSRTKIVVNEWANRHKLRMSATLSGTTRGWRPLELGIEPGTELRESPTMH